MVLDALNIFLAVWPSDYSFELFKITRSTTGDVRRGVLLPPIVAFPKYVRAPWP